MRSMKLVAEGQPLQLFTADPPKPKNKEVLIKVEIAGVCHTDLHLIAGSYDMGEGRKIPTGIRLPITLGHEISGIVEEVAETDQASPPTVQEGDRVVVYPWIGCGSCRRCLSGMDNLCEGIPRFLGIFKDGGYADHVLVPDSRYLVSAASIEDPAQSAPLACSGLTALTSVKKCGLKSDELLLVIGAGGLGLTAIQIAKKLTGARIVVLDIDDSKLESASKAGADHVINSAKVSEKDVVSQVRAANSGRGVDAVIDFVGIPSTSSLGFRLLGREGKLVLVGLVGGSVPFPLPLFPLRGAQVIGNFTGTIRDLVELVELVKRGVISPVVSGVYPLEEADAALQKLRRGEAKGRLVLRP